MENFIRRLSIANKKGYGIVEVLFSSFILTIVAISAVSIFRPIDKQVNAQRLKQSIRAIETAILSATEDPAVLRNFRHDQPFKIPLGASDVLTANSLTPEYFDINGEKCEQGTPACVIKIESLRFVGPNLIYKLEVENMSHGDSGATNVSNFVNPVESSLVVDASLTPFANREQELLSCPQNFIPKGLGATGQFECWKVEVQNCPSNQVPKGLTFREDPLNRVYYAKVECIEPRIFRCPAYHVFNKINLKYLDPNMAMPSDLVNSGSCIFSATGAVDKIDGECPKVAYAPMGGVPELVEDPSNTSKCVLASEVKNLLYEDPIQEEAEATGEEVEITEEDSQEVVQAMIEGGQQIVNEEMKNNPAIAVLDCEKNPTASECDFEETP